MKSGRTAVADITNCAGTQLRMLGSGLVARRDTTQLEEYKINGLPQVCNTTAG
jgi:hypothetical protein